MLSLSHLTFLSLSFFLYKKKKNKHNKTFSLYLSGLLSELKWSKSNMKVPWKCNTLLLFMTLHFLVVVFSFNYSSSERITEYFSSSTLLLSSIFPRSDFTCFLLIYLFLQWTDHLFNSFIIHTHIHSCKKDLVNNVGVPGRG